MASQPVASQPVITVEALTKRFGEIVALDGIDFSVAPGTVLGLLGPAGAGKTTAVRIMTTVLEPDGGRVTVAGFDVVTERAMVRAQLGYTGRSAAMDGSRTGYGFLLEAGRVARLPSRIAERRATELIERLDLIPVAHRIARACDDIRQRRLDMAAALLGRPTVLLLDEPVTGLGPAARLAVWELLGEHVACGATLLLTTRHMDEADQFADQIVTLDRGRVIAEGRAGLLKLKAGGVLLEAVVHGLADLPAATAALARIGGGVPSVTGRRVSVPVTDGKSVLAEAVRELGEVHIALDDLHLRSPSPGLTEVFRHQRWS
ncbi:ATP-binding cassette domain-containing protein [Actinomadura sp. HBU206391]|uniref:ATP-binding cassette domain-containing protein n=1 Tax=Actinomadura sp. HBU206391 TaxID=2731692 RepID=UPI0016509D3C|nr:ATP-binding cassette domain-containing protein [Actinomadura sp. HBU206391]MBC6456902.1 ATP-binding cassette domain-containing protein [Actinomadura sp. HBU206391]